MRQTDLKSRTESQRTQSTKRRDSSRVVGQSDTSQAYDRSGGLKRRIKHELNIATLNVCGLRRKLQYPELKEFFNAYDMICLTETKLDDFDNISIPGFPYLYQKRKQRYLRKSGGIGVFLRNDLSPLFEKIITRSDYVLWLKLEKQISKLDKDFIFGVLYVPPAQSKFLNDEELSVLEIEIVSMCSNFDNVFLTDDINARTGNLDDFIFVDIFLADTFEFDNETLSYFNKADSLIQYGMKLRRSSQDTVVNANGQKFIEMCRGNNIFIANGRIGEDKDVGQFTYRGTSLIDYTLATVEALKLISKFSIIETDPIFSDGHSIIAWSIDITPPQKYHFNKIIDEKPRINWKDDKANAFVANIDKMSVEKLLSDINVMEVNQQSVDSITDKIAHIYKVSANKKFNTSKKYCGNRKQDKPWFGFNCERARSNYHKARKRYNKFKNMQNKFDLHKASKTYKSVINKEINNYNFLKEDKLRKLQTNNPKVYWKYINILNKNQTQNSPSIEEFYKYYKNIGTKETDDTSEIPNEPYFDDIADDLNLPITTEEIMKSILNLKNGKAFGGDHILNEYIRTTADTLMPVYVPLFNKIFDSGILPTSWLEGYIIPIFKNKGNSLHPENYRPITILSCLGKLFTSVLNNRLGNFLEEYDILKEN